MTYPSTADAITGFKKDADRANIFGNGDASATYVSAYGVIVPSIQNLIGQWNYTINVAANGILAQSTAQANAAAASASASAGSASASAGSATSAASSQGAAAGSAASAAASAAGALISQNAAATSEANAASSATNVSALLASFRGVFLGAFASDSAAAAFAAANGITLVSGVMYENTTGNKFRIYNGSAWGDYDASAQASQSAASLSAANAAASESTATAQAAIATTQAGNAATSAGAAAGSAASAGNSLAAITNRYYGNATSDPTSRPDTTAMQVGDRYYNTTSSVEKVYNGSIWTIPNVGAADLASSNPAKGASLVYASDGVSGSLWTTVAGFIAKIISSAGSSVIGFIQSGAGAIARAVQDKLRDSVNLRDFSGVVGDGVSSDVVGLQSALSDGRDVEISSGTYVWDSTITVGAGNRRIVRGKGNVTINVRLPASANMMNASAAVSFENITFDYGNGYVKNGLSYAINCGHVSYRNVYFNNLKDTNNTYGSVLVNINPQGNTFDLSGVYFNNIQKVGNGIITDAAGSLTCINIGGTGTFAKGQISRAYFSEVHNIDGSGNVIYEDTACIYVITPSGDTDNNVSIRDVYGYNFGKRLIKIHASNVVIDNVVGDSTAGDSTGVVTFNNGQGLGNKTGNVVSNGKAYGKMEAAFSSSAIGTKWKNLIAYTTPGNKSGMSNASFGLIVSNDDTEVDGLESGSNYLLSIGSSAQIIHNTRMKNVKLVINSGVSNGFADGVGNLGIDGLYVDGLTVSFDSTGTVIPVYIGQYLDGSTKVARNVKFSNVQIATAGPTNAYGLNFIYCQNISLSTYRYLNTSGNSHFRVAVFDTCDTVNVDDVKVEGTNQVGVHITNCTGYNTANRVQNPGATVAAVYNNNSSNVFASNCDPAKVSGNSINNIGQSVRYTVGTTAQRPTVGLVPGWSKHWDITLSKTVTWNGAQWKDETGATA